MPTSLLPAPPARVLSPPIHRGMTILDRSVFVREFPVVAARVPAAGTTRFAREVAKKYTLRIPKIQTIEKDPTSDVHRLVYLDAQDRSQLPAGLIEILEREDTPLVDRTVRIDYDYWTADEILQAVLPEDLLEESPTSFTQVGHIAHLNLKDEYLPHRFLIGEIILDKNKCLRTVVNKLNTIDNEFRNFRMEVLAGVPDFIVQTSESNCTFTFDFSLVYWNSRLQTEHTKLVSSFSPTEVVVDAFAGVGPFAVPAGKKGCAVLASDLNPASASALEVNTKANKVERNVRTANEDARDFIRKSVVDLWKNPFPAYVVPVSSKVLAKAQRTANASKPLPSPDASLPAPSELEPVSLPPRNLVNHYVMNLPGSAIEFLDSFRSLYLPLYELEGAKEAVEKCGEEGLPLVHCYCFTKGVAVDGSAEKDILERASKVIGMEISREKTRDLRCRFVRDVAPKKEMWCLEFRLSREMVETPM